MKRTEEMAADFVTDVLVAGAGPSGVAAALAARRSGLTVLLVDRQTRLGGTATAGGVTHWLGGRTPGGKWVVGGLFRELSEEAVSVGAALIPNQNPNRIYHPYAWLPWFIHGVVLDGELTAAYLERKLIGAGVEFLYETDVVGVGTSEEKSSPSVTYVRLYSKGSGFQTVRVRAVIDATGDADVAYLAGVPVLVGREEDHLTAPASLTFHLDHIDHAVLSEAIEKGDPKFRPLINGLKEKGEWPFPYDIFISVKGLADDEAMINTSRLVGLDPLDVRSRTAAYVKGREEALKLTTIFRRYFPGFSAARIRSIAPMLGVRESRRLDGAFTLTVEDLRCGRAFPDTIGFSMYGWDLPDPKRPSLQPLVDEAGGKFVNKAQKQLSTPIPFRTMVPRNMTNLLCVGRCISVERDVLGPLRVMAPCMAMGESAGVAAAQLAKGVANDAVDVSLIREELRRRGCIVDQEALPEIEPRVDP